MDAERSVGIALPPGRGAEDLVGVVHPALAGDERERIRRIVLLRGGIEPREPVEQLRHGEVNLAVAVLHELEDLVVLVRREDEARATGEQLLEEHVAEERRSRRRLEGTLNRHRVLHRRLMAACVERRRRGRAVRQRRAERPVEEHRRDRYELRVLGEHLERALHHLAAVRGGQLAQLGERVVAGQVAHGAQQARVDLGLRQRPRKRLEERRAEVEEVPRPLEVEERRLPLLVLRRGRQHVVRELGRLRVGDVDDDREVERANRRLEPDGIGRRVRRVGRLDPERAHAPRVVAQDLVGEAVRRQEAADDLLARHARALALRVAKERQEPGVDAVRPGSAEVAGHEVEQLLEVGVQRRMPALLDAELDPYDHRPRRENHVDRALDVGERDVGVRHPRLDRRAREHGPHVLPADGVPGKELRRLATPPQDDRQNRGEQEGVRAGTKRQVEIGDVRDLRAPRIDHDHAAAGRLLDLVHLVAAPPGSRSPSRDCTRAPRAARCARRPPPCGRADRRRAARSPRSRRSSPARAR